MCVLCCVVWCVVRLSPCRAFIFIIIIAIGITWPCFASQESPRSLTTLSPYTHLDFFFFYYFFFSCTPPRRSSDELHQQ